MTEPASSGGRERRPPIDPRLWRYSARARGYLVLVSALSMLDTAMVVVSALCIGRTLAGLVVNHGGSLADSRTLLIVLAAAVLVRVAANWAQNRFGDRIANRSVAELKSAVLRSASALPPRELDARRDEIATVATRGLDALGPYLTGYLPALILAVTLTPVTWLVIAFNDLTSAIIIAVTIPLIPVFMILIGLLTQGKSARTLEAMTTLSARLLDLLAGLPTLRALGREQGPESRVRELGDTHRRQAMSALRLAFLSSMVLELLATLCVALVAVSIGMRLVYGDMDLQPGVIALILAPEVYLPLRMVGQRFHAAEDGMAAARAAFALLDEQPGEPWTGSGGVAAPTGAPITVESVSVRARDGFAPFRAGAVVRPGRVTVLTGANGAGKSTLLSAVLGLTRPEAGRVLLGETDLEAIDLRSWWAQLSWLPQRAVLIPGTVRENLDLNGPLTEFDTAATASGFDQVLETLPSGLETQLGVGGVGLSLGQRQRLALTRTLASRRPVLLLDEPTAHLDEETEAGVLGALRGLAADGATVVMVGHRPAVLAAADEVVQIHSAPMEAMEWTAVPPDEAVTS